MLRENWCESLWRVANVRILFILLCVFDDFEFNDFMWVLYMFCEHAFDRCWRMSNLRVWFVLQCFVILLGSWKGQTEASVVFYTTFIHVSRKFMWEFVEGFQCSNFVYFMRCFWWFRILLILYWFCVCFVEGSGRWPGGHRALTSFARCTSTAL